MRKRISLEARVRAAIARTSFSSSIPFSRSTGSSGRERPSSTAHFGGDRRSGAHRQELPGASPAAVVPTSGALRFEAECQPIGGFAARQTSGSMCPANRTGVRVPASAAERHLPRLASCQLQRRSRAALAPAGRSARAGLARRPARSASCPAAPGGSGRAADRPEPTWSPAARRRPLTAQLAGVERPAGVAPRRRQAGGQRPGRPRRRRRRAARRSMAADRELAGQHVEAPRLGLGRDPRRTAAAMPRPRRRRSRRRAPASVSSWARRRCACAPVRGLGMGRRRLPATSSTGTSVSCSRNRSTSPSSMLIQYW